MLSSNMLSSYMTPVEQLTVYIKNNDIREIPELLSKITSKEAYELFAKLNEWYDLQVSDLPKRIEIARLFVEKCSEYSLHDPLCRFIKGWDFSLDCLRKCENNTLKKEYERCVIAYCEMLQKHRGATMSADAIQRGFSLASIHKYTDIARFLLAQPAAEKIEDRANILLEMDNGFQSLRFYLEHFPSSVNELCMLFYYVIEFEYSSPREILLTELDKRAPTVALHLREESKQKKSIIPLLPTSIESRIKSCEFTGDFSGMNEKDSYVLRSQRLVMVDIARRDIGKIRNQISSYITLPFQELIANIYYDLNIVTLLTQKALPTPEILFFTLRLNVTRWGFHSVTKYLLEKSMANNYSYFAQHQDKLSGLFFAIMESDEIFSFVLDRIKQDSAQQFCKALNTALSMAVELNKPNRAKQIIETLQFFKALDQKTVGEAVKRAEANNFSDLLVMLKPLVVAQSSTSQIHAALHVTTATKKVEAVIAPASSHSNSVGSLLTTNQKLIDQYTKTYFALRK